MTSGEPTQTSPIPGRPWFNEGEERGGLGSMLWREGGGVSWGSYEGIQGYGVMTTDEQGLCARWTTLVCVKSLTVLLNTKRPLKA